MNEVETSGHCPLDCPDACSLSVQVRGEVVIGVDGSDRNPLTGGYICAKVRGMPRHMYGPERLVYPAVRDGDKGTGSFRRASWDEALGLVAERLTTAARRYGGESILPFSYGGSNGLLTQDTTDARLFRRLGASRLGRTVCAAPTTAAATGLYGKIQGVAFQDYVHARLIVIWGCNPAVTGIHLLEYVREARRRGARLVVVDPRRNRLARQADLHLPVRPGTDVVLALSIADWLFANGHADRQFLESQVNGVEEFRRRAALWPIERAAEVSGLPSSAIEQLARWYAESNPAVIRSGWGMERNRNGGSAAAAVLALPAVAGKFGVRGGGYTLSNSPLAFRFDPAKAINEPCRATREVNMNHLGRVLASSDDPPIKVLFSYNCNPVAVLPEQSRVMAGLRREDLFTVVFEQVMTETARYADVLLPATTFLEHTEVRAGYGATVLQRATAAVAPLGEARPNYQVFGDLCRAVGLDKPGDVYSAEDLTTAIVGAEFDGQLRRDGIVVADPGDAAVPFVDLLPATGDGKIDLLPQALEDEAPGGMYHYRQDPGTERHPLALISPATSRTVSSTFGQLREGQVPVQMHPDDARERNIRSGDRVRLFNDLGEVHCLAQVTTRVRPGVLSLPKGLWSHNTLNGHTSNTLVSDALTDIGGGACFNDARVQASLLDE